MPPTKQAKSQGNCGKEEPKLHQVTEWRKKNLGRTQAKWGAVLHRPTKE